MLNCGLPGRLVESNEESMQVKVVNVVLRVCRCYHLLPSLILDVDDGVYWGECTISPAWRMCTGIGRYEVSVAVLRDGVP